MGIQIFLQRCAAALVSVSCGSLHCCQNLLMGSHQDQEYDQSKKLQLGSVALVSVMWKFAS